MCRKVNTTICGGGVCKNSFRQRCLRTLPGPPVVFRKYRHHRACPGRSAVARQGGRSSIPEALRFNHRGRGVLDTRFRGYDAVL